MCLSNMPDTRTLYGGRRCGNGYLEDGEECDCGEEEVSVGAWLERGETLHCCQSFRPSEGQCARSLPSCQHFLHTATTDRLRVRCRQFPGGWSLWPLPLWATAQATDLPRGAPGGVLGPPAALSLLWRPEFTQPEEHVKLTQDERSEKPKDAKLARSQFSLEKRSRDKGAEEGEAELMDGSFLLRNECGAHTPSSVIFIRNMFLWEKKKKSRTRLFHLRFLKDEKMLTLA